MQANTSIGEVVISLEDGREFLLRPSFYAINKIGSPEEIDNAINKCFDAFSDGYKKNNKIKSQFFQGYLNYLGDDLSSEFVWNERIESITSVWRVIKSCLVNDADSFELFGYLDDSREVVEGKVSLIECAILANHLIKWGVMGSPSDTVVKSNKSKGKKELFDPQKYVGSAIAHLGLSKDDAWSLTMTEFQRAIEAKFPDEKEQIDESELEALEAMARKAHEKLPKNRMSNQHRLNQQGR